MMDALTALRLQAEWGADEAIAEAPLDRFARPAPAERPRPAPPAVVATGPEAGVGALTLDALHAALDAFHACPLRATATHTVRPDGNPSAGLVLIGEAPGSDDDRSGRSFSGEPGAVLDRVLGSIGLDRTKLLVTTLVPWRPPGGRKLAESEIQACLPFLLRLLAIVRPQRLVLLGAVPVRVLTGNTESMRRLRGRWLDVLIPEIDTPVTAKPIPPLDQWLQSATSKQELWADMIQLRNLVTSP